jgi:2-keto-3-deoxy-L-rhamnonate aldolase RhmA
MTGSDLWARNRNNFKRLVDAGEPALAMWVNLPWQATPEILASCGCDAALIDMEHTTSSIQDVLNMIIACAAAGITPFYRPSGMDTANVARALDSGAQGIIFPNINTRDEAERAVASCRLPPLGNRPWAGAHTRQAVWNGIPAAAALREPDPRLRGVHSAEYVDMLNNEVLVVLMIESPEGVANLNAILDVPGIHSIRFGWADYSIHVGFDLDKCQRAADLTYETCRAKGVGYSFTLGQAGQHPHYPGCWYGVGLDTLLFAGALRDAVAAARERVGRTR